MNNRKLNFLATASAIMAGAWVGLVVDAATGRVLFQTIHVYRTRDQARFGARCKWVEWQRVQKLQGAA